MDKMRLVQKGYISSRNTVGLFDERENEIMWIDRLDEYDVEKGKTYIDLVRLKKNGTYLTIAKWNLPITMSRWVWEYEIWKYV